MTDIVQLIKKKAVWQPQKRFCLFDTVVVYNILKDVGISSKFIRGKLLFVHGAFIVNLTSTFHCWLQVEGFVLDYNIGAYISEAKANGTLEADFPDFIYGHLKGYLPERLVPLEELPP